MIAALVLCILWVAFGVFLLDLVLATALGLAGDAALECATGGRC